MEAFFAQPLVQTVLLPLLASLLLALGLLGHSPRWQGLAILLGFLLAVLAIVGPALTPLTSTRKIVLVSLFIPLLALGLDTHRLKTGLKLFLLSLASGAALLWVLWPVLSRQELADAVLQAAALVAYVLVIVLGFVRLSQCCARFTGAAVAFAVATGVVVMLGSSALYAQLSFALAAAVGGWVLARLFRPSLLANRPSHDAGCPGLSSAMAVAVPLAVLGAAASVYARVPMTTLPLLAIAPWVALIPLVAQRPAWLRMSVAGALVLGVSAPAVYWVWSAVAAMESGGYY